PRAGRPGPPPPAAASRRALPPAPRASPGGSDELAEEAQVVLEEEADVVDAVLEHRDPLDAHAERPPRDRLGIVPHIAEHLRVDHPRAQDLQPARLADAAAHARAEETEHIHLRRRLGERNARRAEAELRAL